VASANGATLISLVSAADELCFTCHAKSKDAHLHAPYAQGDCTVCHSPHSSNWPDHLLASPQNICMGCHVRGRLKINRQTRTATVPWGVTLTFDQLKGWQYLRLNKALTANHPIEGHPVAGPNTALGEGAPVIFQEVVHSIRTGEADCDEQSSFPGEIEWTSTRMPDLPSVVESNWLSLYSPATLSAPPHGAFW
jgi:predicted CXXCH cytochrome family protein